MGVQKLCHMAVTHQTLSRGDVVFSDLETPANPRMFFVISGRLLYSKQNPGESMAGVKQTPGKGNQSTQTSSVSVSSSEASAATEASLWTRWIHRGTLKAVSECTLLAMDADKFQRIISPFPTHHAHLYASAFVELLNVLDNSALTDLRIVDQEDLVDCAFPEMITDDERTSVSWRTTRRLSHHLRAKRTKSRIWQ